MKEEKPLTEKQEMALNQVANSLIHMSASEDAKDHYGEIISMQERLLDEGVSHSDVTNISDLVFKILSAVRHIQ